jgi:hypothetical protein
VVEPQAPAADQLRELYRGKNRIVILQGALDGESGRRTLFTVDSQFAPSWAGGQTSFQRETIVKHSDLIPGLETMIKETLSNASHSTTFFDACLPKGSISYRSILEARTCTSCRRFHFVV